MTGTNTENAGPRKVRGERSLIEALAKHPGELVKTIERGKKYICQGTERKAFRYVFYSGM